MLLHFIIVLISSSPEAPRRLFVVNVSFPWQRVLYSKTLIKKKGKRKVQGVSQSQTAALPRHHEEEETDKSKQAQIKQTYEKH